MGMCDVVGKADLQYRQATARAGHLATVVRHLHRALAVAQHAGCHGAGGKQHQRAVYQEHTPLHNIELFGHHDDTCQVVHDVGAPGWVIGQFVQHLAARLCKTQQSHYRDRKKYRQYERADTPPERL